MKNFTKFLVGASVALALALTVGVTASNAAYMQNGTLKLGSKGSQVMVLQQTLNMTSCKVATSGVGSAGFETTTFAAKTKAAVQCFQSANGLTTDGIVGPVTGAKLAAVSGSTTVNTGMPAGCTSSTGFSTTTGTPCSGTPGTTVFPAGCVSSNGFSSTTGVACSSTSTGVVSNGPFSINTVTPVSGYLNTQVGVGTVGKPIGDFRIVTGAGGSGNVTGLNLSFYNRGNGDYQFIKYASAVSVWLNGVKVGSLPASSFTQYNSQYSAFIPVSGAVLNPSSTNDLVIAVDALPVIDTANLGSTHNNFAFEVTSLRYTDSTGSFQYSIPSSNNFDGGNLVSGALNSSAVFASASSASNITLTVTKDSNDYNDHVVAGQVGSNVQNQTLATVDLAAQGSAVTVNRLPVHIAVTNSGSGSTNAGSVINTLRLYQGTTTTGQAIDTETVPLSANPQVIFQNLNLTIPAGSTQVFTITGDINPIDGTVLKGGATAQVSVLSADVTAIQAYDSNNNILNNTSSTTLTGSTTGSVVTFFVNGIQVGNTTATSVSASSVGGTQSHQTVGMTIPFSVTAFGTTAYVPSTATAHAGSSNSATVQFCVDDATGACVANGTGVITYAGSDNLQPVSGNYQIPAGQTKNFTLQITESANGSASYRASLINVPWSNLSTASSYTGDQTTGFVNFTSGLNSNSFKTPYITAQ